MNCCRASSFSCIDCSRTIDRKSVQVSVEIVTSCCRRGPHNACQVARAAPFGHLFVCATEALCLPGACQSKEQQFGEGGARQRSAQVVIARGAAYAAPGHAAAALTCAAGPLPVPLPPWVPRYQDAQAPPSHPAASCSLFRAVPQPVRDGA